MLDLPVPGFDLSQQDSTIYLTDQSQFSATISYSFGDGNSSIASNPVHTYSDSGVYVVQQTVANSCGNKVFTQSVWIEGGNGQTNGIQINDTDFNKLRLYPNPTQDQFQILGLREGDEIQLIGALGKTVDVSFTTDHKCNISNLP